MKVAFVTDRDPFDVHAWSGLIYYIYDSLSQTGIDITPVGNLANRYRPLNLITKLAYLSMGAKYHWYCDPIVLAGSECIRASDPLNRCGRCLDCRG
jgi:hypothetical protein